MKRLLSVILSLSLLYNLAQISEAKTNYINNNEAVICKSKDGERVCIRGENLPPININNKNKAIANSSSKSKSNSKSSSTSNGGGSGIGQKILLGLALFLGWKAYSLKNSIGGGFSASIDKATGWFQNFVGNNQSGTDQNSGQNGNQGNAGSETDQGSEQNESQGDSESEADQGLGQNGSPDSQINAETEGGTRFNWGNFSLTGTLLNLAYYIGLASSKLGRSSMDQANPLFQNFF